MKLVSLLSMLFLFQMAHALDAKEVIAKMQQVYNKEAHLEYDCTYELFKGHKSNEVETSYKGHVYRNKTSIYQKIDQTEFIYANDFFLQINHSERAAVLSRAQKSVNLNVDMNTALKECSKLEMEKKEGYYTIVMWIKSGSSLPFSIVKLRVDADKFYLERLDLYYSSTQDFSTDPKVTDEQKPHMRITFKEPKLNPKTRESYFNLSTYIKTTDNRLSPTGTIEGYSFIDNRIN
jgi:uncharacterized protein YjhX (UPF0386 family)